MNQEIADIKEAQRRIEVRRDDLAMLRAYEGRLERCITVSDLVTCLVSRAREVNSRLQQSLEEDEKALATIVLAVKADIKSLDNS